MGILTFLAGAKRWLNPEVGKALIVAVVAIAILVGLACLHGAGTASGSAKANASWLHKLNAAMALSMKRRAEQNRAARDAVAKSLEQAEAERNEAINRAAAVAAELALLKDDPVVFPRSLARELSR